MTDRDALRLALNTLTDERIGTWQYMEGSDVYDDFRKAADAIRSALAAPQPEPIGRVVSCRHGAFDMIQTVASVMSAVWELVRSGPNFDGRQDDVKRAIESAIEAAVLAEREACARECDKLDEAWSYAPMFASRCAAAIRSRTDPQPPERAQPKEAP